MSIRAYTVLICVTGILTTSPRSLSAQVDETLAQRAAVLTLLAVPVAGTMPEIARSRGASLSALGFDALPVASAFLADDAVSTDAAYAMLGADETRGLTMIFASIPASGPNIQRIAFTWFLDRYTTFGEATNREARVAALRTLDPVRSTANAEAALYILGLTGSSADLPVLEFHAVNVRTGSRGMREASQAALLRLGSKPHLERIRSELARPLPENATYQQGVTVAAALQKAGFSGSRDLIPVICSHLQDRPLRDVEFNIDTGRSARLALNAIVDGVSVTHLSRGVRSAEEWASYCATSLLPPPVL
jgi:hypothetical protein